MATAQFLTGLAGGFASGREQRRRELQDQLDRSTRQAQTDFENALALRRMEEDRRREWKQEGQRERDIEREADIREQDLARRAKERAEDEERGRLSQQTAFENQRQLQEERIIAAFGAREQQAQERALAEAQAQAAEQQAAQEAQAQEQAEVLRQLTIREMPASQQRSIAMGEVGDRPGELLTRTIKDLGRTYGLDPSRLLSPQEIARTTLLQQQEEAAAQELMARQQFQEAAQIERAALQLGATSARAKAATGQPVDPVAEYQAARRSLTLATPQGQAAAGPAKEAVIEQSAAALLGLIPAAGATDEELLGLIDENFGPDDVDALLGFGFTPEEIPVLRGSLFQRLRPHVPQRPQARVTPFNLGLLFSGAGIQ